MPSVHEAWSAMKQKDHEAEELRELAERYKIPLFIASARHGTLHRLDTGDKCTYYFLSDEEGIMRLNLWKSLFIDAINLGLLEVSGECDTEDIKLSPMGKRAFYNYTGQIPIIFKRQERALQWRMWGF